MIVFYLKGFLDVIRGKRRNFYESYDCTVSKNLLKLNKVARQKLVFGAVEVYIVHNPFLRRHIVHDLFISEPNFDLSLCFFWRF